MLALFGELDNNILPEKNKDAWQAALKAGGNRDSTLRILPKANHEAFEAKVGNNVEMATLRRLVPEYATTVQDWLVSDTVQKNGPGLIVQGRDAQRRPCRLNPERLHDVALWAERFRRNWEESFQRLDEYLSEIKKKEKRK